MLDQSDWIALATTPPASPDDLDRLAQTLEQAHIQAQIETNPVRQCERDPAAWLRVDARDLDLARDLARRIGIDTM